MQLAAVHDNAPVLVNVSDETAVLLAVLAEPKRGQFAFVHDHVSGLDDKKCTTPHKSNILFLTSPRYDRYLARLQLAVSNMTLAQFTTETPAHLFQKLYNKAQAEGTDIASLFDAGRLAILTETAAKMAGTFESAQAEAHDVCYATVNGWKCHLETEPVKVDGKVRKRPVIGADGLCTVKSIMLPFYQCRRWTIVAGVWKPTDSCARVLTRAAILDVTRLPDWKTFSLQKGNYSRLAMDGAVIYGDVTASDQQYERTECPDADAMVIGGLTNPVMYSLAEAAGKFAQATAQAQA